MINNCQSFFLASNGTQPDLNGARLYFLSWIPLLKIQTAGMEGG